MKPCSHLGKPFFRRAVCVLTLAVAFAVAPVSAQLPVIRFVRDPDPAPTVKLKDLSGKELNLESSRGKVVLLNFWASWCAPCREEIPGLVALQEHCRDGLQIIGLVVDDDDEKEIRSVMDSEKINYPVALADGK